MASYRKLPRGRKRHQVRWRDPDGSPRSDTCVTKASAFVLLKKVQACEDRHQRYEPVVVQSVPSIGEAVMLFLESLRRSHAPQTVAQYEQAFGIFATFGIARGLDEAPISDMSMGVLEAFYDDLAIGLHDNPRGLYTKRRLVQKVEAAWQHAYDTDKDNVVPRPCVGDWAKPVRSPVAAPTFAEMAACVKACVSEGATKTATILYYTGCRSDQARTVKWDDVDMAGGTITFAPQKGLPGRIIPMSPHFVKALEGWGAREGLLCGWHVVRQLADRRLNEAWARAGVREAVWTRAPAQAFRRGMTTGLARLGVSVEMAELYVGRGVQGARERYLDVGALPFEDVAALIPSIESHNTVSIKRGQG